MLLESVEQESCSNKDLPAKNQSYVQYILSNKHTIEDIEATRQIYCYFWRFILTWRRLNDGNLTDAAADFVLLMLRVSRMCMQNTRSYMCKNLVMFIYNITK